MLTRYEEDAARERRMWRGLTRAACGNTIYVLGVDQRDAARMFKQYVTALIDVGLDGSLWSARRANGNMRILFENGGEVRFVSFRAHQDGMRARMVVVDE